MLNMSGLAFVPMTKTVTIAAILAVSAGLLFAVPMAVDAANHDLWKDLDSATKSTKGNSLKLTVTADDAIPKDFPTGDVNPSKVVVGYAWVDAFTDGGDLRGDEIVGFVTAIHPTFDDSNQNPWAWHSHSVVLVPHPDRPTPPNFCLAELGTTQAGIQIKGDTMKVNTPLKQSGSDYDGLDVATSFTVNADEDCSDYLGLRVFANSLNRGTQAGITE